MKNKIVLIKTAPEKILQGQWYQRPWMGLGVLASFLMNQGIDCEIIDMQFFNLSMSDTIRKIQKSKADFFGITAMTHEINRAHELAAAIKNINPHSMIMLGGPHVTALPMQTMKEFPHFDFGVFGEGELTIKELIYSVTNGHSIRQIKGLTFRDENDVIVNSSRPWLEDLDSLPFPAWDFYPKCKEYPIYSSRGCPFSCAFCMRVLGKKVRYRSPKNVVDEMESVVEKYSPVRITFQDETFTVNLSRANEILELIIQRGLNKKVIWDISTRVNIGDLSFYKRLKKAGCYKICIGVESGNDNVLREIGKGITKKDAERCVELAKKVGLKTEAYFILGHPNENESKMLETINFAAKLNTTTAAFGIMVPYPGTKIYDMATKGEAGYKIITHKWSDFNKHLGNALELENLGRKKLELLQLKAYLTFYIKNYRFKELIMYVIDKRRALIFTFKKLFLKRFT